MKKFLLILGIVVTLGLSTTGAALMADPGADITPNSVKEELVADPGGDITPKPYGTLVADPGGDITPCKTCRIAG